MIKNICIKNPEQSLCSTLNLIHKWRRVFEWKCVSNWVEVKARLQSEGKKNQQITLTKKTYECSRQGF